ncbi:hypothetical protein EW145_g2639 [Phellinidium pouzarii]|uniref:PEBP-like protein n=1 Tax=Phellinidium pouzarii TaxID=167371 RepID=A0A4S4LAB0_9AGAM|nr:hypothetical protein EW145_g2639 [Phellinidium pouzarii]
MFTPLVLTLSLVSLVAAQDSALQVEAIQAQFSNAGLVPDLLSTFVPSALMNVSFDGVNAISPGQALSQSQVAPTPVVTVALANSSVSLGNNFTIVMVDADVVGTDESSKGQTRHWLVNSASLSGAYIQFKLGNVTVLTTVPRRIGTGSDETVSNSSATVITEYAGPAPASGSGAHRYVILLYTQPTSFTPPANLSSPNIGVSVFSLSDYVSSTGLEGPVAGMYFTVEVGTASFTVSATSSVVTSTLAVPPSGTGGSGTSTSSGSAASASNAAVGVTSATTTGIALFMGVFAALLFV